MQTRNDRSGTTRRRIAGVLLGGSALGTLITLAARTSGPAGPDASRLCWALVIVGIVGTMMAGRGIGWGWLLLFGLQPLWIGYALVTEQYGFVVSAVAYGVGQLQGYLRSRTSIGRRTPCERVEMPCGPPGHPGARAAAAC